MKLFKEKPGVISKEAVWVFIHQGYLYISPTFLGLLKQIIFEYKNDKHLAG